KQRPLTEMKSARPVVISGDFIPRFVSYFSRFMYPIMLPIFWVFFFFWKLMAAFFYSLIGLAINAAISAEAGYSTVYKFTLYAQTPVILLQAVLLPLHRPLPLPIVFL